MKRGDLVTVAIKGDYGKPRPAVVVQSDWLADTESVLVCLMTHIGVLGATEQKTGLRTGIQNWQGAEGVSHAKDTAKRSTIAGNFCKIWKPRRV